MNLYRFSPIANTEELYAAIGYVAKEVLGLAEKVTGDAYAISYLTIFAHYPDEYENLIKLLGDLGKTSDANNGMKVELNRPIAEISLLRIRKPDPYRMQVGCADLDVGDYETFRSKYLDNSKGLRLINRPKYEMIEFFDPDFDVLAYAVSGGFE
jgi:hypothetical protein